MSTVAIHPHDEGFVNTQLNAVSANLHDSVLVDYSNQYQDNGRREANLSLLKATKKASLSPCTQDDDQTLKDRGAVKAALCERVYQQQGLEGLKAVAEREKIELPVVPKSTNRLDSLEPVEAGIAKRLANAKWWTRQLRKQQDRSQEQQAINLGLVGYGKEAYCSNAALMQVLSRKAANREYMESLDAVNLDTGDIIPMQQVINAGVANPANLRNETMQKIADAETFFIERHYVPLFLTLTLPSKYHRMKKVGGLFRENADGKRQRVGGKVVPNDKYQEKILWESGRGASMRSELRDNSPRLGQLRMRQNWSRARAALNDAQVDYEWLRAVEPHHDGCPHWHMIVFVKASQVVLFKRIICNQWLREDGKEAGALKNRVEIVRIEAKRGGAASYVAKYIAKNIDGFNVGEDFETGLDATDSVLRVQAWRSTWGIRGFQFSQGMGAIGVWRELRRIAQDVDISGSLQSARLAADDSNYYGFLKIQEALNGLGNNLTTIKQLSPQPNSYGELTSVVVGVGLADNLVPTEGTKQLVTRPYSWELVNHEAAKERADELTELTDNPEADLILSRVSSSLGILENNCRKTHIPDFDKEGKLFEKRIIHSLWHENAYCPEIKARPKEKYLTFVAFHNEMTKVSDSGLKIEEAQRLQLLAMRDAGCLEVMV